MKVQRRKREKMKNNFRRIWIKGKLSAFQAGDMGSIPVIRNG
jgi:hypothetical protein